MRLTMTSLRFLADRRSRTAAGYTLIELMIALALGAAILLALTLLFAQNSGNQQDLERTLRQIENARFSIDTLGEDVMHAGFFSDFNPDRVDPPPTYTSPSPCATALTALGWNAAANPMELPRPVEGIVAGTAATLACFDNHLAGTEALVVRRAETGPTIPWTAGRADNLYIQASRCPDDADRIRVSSVPATDPQLTFSLRTPNCANPNNALRRLLQRTYYVSACNDCASNDGIPTLKRVEMVNGALRTTAIAEGVEDLQVEFGVDNPPNPDGVPDTWLTADTVGAGDWRNVVAVRLHVLTRTTQPVPGFAETRTYRVGPAVTLTPNDGFRRTLLSSSVRLNNVGSRRE
jgi:type IV pilus assembly protein PilW